MLKWMREGTTTEAGQVVRRMIDEKMFDEIQGRILITSNDGKVIMR